MTKPPFQQIEKLFHEAIALPPQERSAFLGKACAGDDALRTAVDALLRNIGPDDPTDAFLASPVAGEAARFRAQPITHLDKDSGTNGASRTFPGIPGYEILEELGRGGMGVVYKAKQINLGRIVALKMLLPSDAALPEMLARFRTEVETLARLQHPNIITIYDIGEFENRPYFTMEYVAGPSLDRLLQGRPQDVSSSAKLIETLARTMHTVHQNGIIHRDLKPANILLQTPGNESGLEKKSWDPRLLSESVNLQSAHVKITDFGLAKDQAAAGKITVTGVTMGTPGYMAPEQAKSSNVIVGPAADIYSLGSILYEMLTGRPPFEGESPADILSQLLNDEPLSPTRLRPRLPRDLVTICLKCLEKTPRKRYGTALDLAEDLRRFQEGLPIRARAVGLVGRAWRWCRRRPLVASLILLSSLLLSILVVTVLAYDFWLQEALAKAQVKTEVQHRQIVDLNINIGITEMENGDAFKSLLRFTEALRLDEDIAQSESHRARIADALKQCPRLLQLRVDDKNVLCVKFSPGGDWLATMGPGNEIEVRNILTGSQVGISLSPKVAPFSGAISHDGQTLATIDSKGGPRLWEVKSGKYRELPLLMSQKTKRIAFHPDGRVLLTHHEDSTIRLWKLTEMPQEIPEAFFTGKFLHVAFSENDRWLLTVDADQVAKVWDVGTGAVKEEPLVINHPVSFAAIGPDGREIIFQGPDKKLHIWETKGAKWTEASMDSAEALREIVFSPDGKRFLTCEDHGFEVRQAPTGTPLCVLHIPEVAHPHFSGDGRFLVITNLRDGTRVWDSVAGKAVTPPIRSGKKMVWIDFCNANRQVACVSGNGTIAIWELPGAEENKKEAGPERWPVADLIILAQILAGGRINDHQEYQTLESKDLNASWKALQSKH